VELVRRSQGGDREAFGLLVRRYQDRIYNTTLRLLGDPDDAAEVAQEAFLRAYENIGGFKGKSAFSTWLYRIAINCAFSRRRKRQVAKEVTLKDSVSAPGNPHFSAPSSPLEKRERNRLVQEALAALPANLRAVVVLRDLEGLNYEAVGRVLKVSQGTVKSRLHRARTILREKLKGLS
jgi:RNA polymerase sigma-70 factor (ECF subfamily)